MNGRARVYHRFVSFAVAAVLGLGGQATMAQIPESEHSLQLDFQLKEDPVTKERSGTVTYYLDGAFLISEDLASVIKDTCAIDSVSSSLDLAQQAIAFNEKSWKELQASLQTIAVSVDGAPYGTMNVKQETVNIEIDDSFLAAASSAAPPTLPTIDQCCTRKQDVRENCDGPHPLRTNQEVTLPCQYSDGCRIRSGTKTCNLVQDWETTTCVTVTTTWYVPKSPTPSGCTGFVCPAVHSTVTSNPVVRRTLVGQFFDRCGECR